MKILLIKLLHYFHYYLFYSYYFMEGFFLKPFKKLPPRLCVDVKMRKAPNAFRYLLKFPHLHSYYEYFEQYRRDEERRSWGHWTIVPAPVVTAPDVATYALAKTRLLVFDLETRKFHRISYFTLPPFSFGLQIKGFDPYLPNLKVYFDV